MDNLLNSLLIIQSSRIPELSFIAGILLIFLAIGVQVKMIRVPPNRTRLLGFLGTLFLAGGLLLYLPGKINTSSDTSNVSGLPTIAATPGMLTPEFPTATAEAATLAPVELPSITAEPQSTEALAKLLPPADWTMMMQDEFIDNKYQWETFDGNGKKAALLDGKYIFEVTSAEKDNLYLRNQPKVIKLLSNIFYGTDLQIKSASLNTSCGLVFHIKDLGAKKYGYYLFEINNKQEYQVRKIDNMNKDNSKTLIELTHTDAIKSEKINRLLVITNDVNFEFYINDVSVASLIDTSFTAGLVGVAVHVDKKGEQALCEFDNATIWSPTKH